MSSSSSSSSIASLRERLAALSGTHKPTPLWVYLYMYHKAEHDCYINYMEGAKALYDYLKPIALPNLKISPAVDWSLGCYETLELAKIVCEYNQHFDGVLLGKTHTTIVACTLLQLPYKLFPEDAKLWI